jgi:hypothetical protein
LIFANAADNSVIAIAQHKGSAHDFRIFKENFEGASDKIKFLADSGFQGILEFHKNSETPIKSSKNHKLTAKEKAYNHELSKRRIFIEHINGWIKRFKILAYKYRNKRLRHGLRVSLICGIYNAMLG